MNEQNHIINLVQLLNMVNVQLGKTKKDYFLLIKSSLCLFFSICVRGQFHCNSENCEKSKITCPNNLIFTETSLSACPKTCSNHLVWKNCHKYRSGCDCPKNMIHDEHVRLIFSVIEILICFLFLYRQIDVYFLNIVHVNYKIKYFHMVQKLLKIVTNGLSFN
jgi:hypothetical protein